MRAEIPRSCSAYVNNSSPEGVSVTVRLSLSNNLTPKSLSSDAIREEMAVCVVCNFSDAALKLRSLATHTNASIKRRFLAGSIRGLDTRLMTSSRHALLRRGGNVTRENFDSRRVRSKMWVGGVNPP